MELYEPIKKYAREAVLYTMAALAPMVFTGCPNEKTKEANTDEPNIEYDLREIQATEKNIDYLTRSLDDKISETAAKAKKLDEENKGLMDKINREAEEQKKKDEEILEGYGIK